MISQTCRCSVLMVIGTWVLMPSRRRLDPEPTLSIFPDQVHIGDRFTDADTDGAAEWEVVSRPVTFKKGHEVRARVQRPGNLATAREKYWAAHEKVTVRRMTAPPPRPTAEAETIGDMKAILGTAAPPSPQRGALAARLSQAQPPPP